MTDPSKYHTYAHVSLPILNAKNYYSWNGRTPSLSNMDDSDQIVLSTKEAPVANAVAQARAFRD
jgi:hypothetical protein